MPDDPKDPPDKPPRSPPPPKPNPDDPQSLYDILGPNLVPEWLKDIHRKIVPRKIDPEEVSTLLLASTPTERKWAFTRMAPVDLQHVTLEHPSMRQHVIGRPGHEDPLARGAKSVKAPRILFAGEERCGKTALALAMVKRRIDLTGCTAAYVDVFDLEKGTLEYELAQRSEIVVIDSVAEDTRRETQVNFETLVHERYKRGARAAMWFVASTTMERIKAKYTRQFYRLLTDGEVFPMGLSAAVKQKDGF